MPFDPWWSVRKKTLIPQVSVDLTMSMWTSSACDFQSTFFVHEQTSPFSLHAFFLALFVVEDFWEPVQMWAEKHFWQGVQCKDCHLQVQQCITSCENGWENWGLHGENYTPPLTSAPRRFSVLGWRWWRHSMWSGSHHLVGLAKYDLVIHDVTWKSETLILMAAPAAVTTGLLGEGWDYNSGVDGISHQRREFSVFLEESKLQKLLWGISFLFSFFMLAAVKDTGNRKCFLDDDISTFNYIISICWLESWWRRSERRTYFFFLKDPSVSFMKLDV